MNDKEFKKGFLVLTEMFNKNPSKPFTLMYFETVKHLAASDWQNAIKVTLQNRKFTNMPTPAEILEHAQGSPEDAAIIAIQKLETAMGSVGAHDSVMFDDPVLHALVSTSEGGWPGLCQMPLKDWKFEKQRLVKAYKALSSQGVPQEVKQLAGIAERENGGSFPSWKPTVHRIGNSPKATMIENEKVLAIEGKSEFAPMPEEFKAAVRKLGKNTKTGKVKEGV